MVLALPKKDSKLQEKKEEKHYLRLMGFEPGAKKANFFEQSSRPLGHGGTVHSNI